jgi:hypothetical protein
MSDADRLARMNRGLIAQGQGYGEPVTLITARGTVAVGAIVDVIPQEIPGMDGAWERAPVAWIRASDLPAAPSQGDAIITAAGVRWLVDSWDERRGLYECVLRAESRA